MEAQLGHDEQPGHGELPDYGHVELFQEDGIYKLAHRLTGEVHPLLPGQPSSILRLLEQDASLVLYVVVLSWTLQAWLST
jgi:hypothetical protein